MRLWTWPPEGAPLAVDFAGDGGLRHRLPSQRHRARHRRLRTPTSACATLRPVDSSAAAPGPGVVDSVEFRDGRTLASGVDDFRYGCGIRAPAGGRPPVDEHGEFVRRAGLQAGRRHAGQRVQGRDGAPLERGKPSALGVLVPDDDRAPTGERASIGHLGLAFTPDGAILASAGDPAGLLWDVRPRRPLGRPLGRKRAGCAAWRSRRAARGSRGVDGTLRCGTPPPRAPGRPLDAPGPGARGRGERGRADVGQRGERRDGAGVDAESRRRSGRRGAGHRGREGGGAQRDGDGRERREGRDGPAVGRGPHEPLGAPLPSRVGRSIAGLRRGRRAAGRRRAGRRGRVVDAESPRAARPAHRPRQVPQRCRLSPDGEILAGVGQDSALWLWDADPAGRSAHRSRSQRRAGKRRLHPQRPDPGHRGADRPSASGSRNPPAARHPARGPQRLDQHVAFNHDGTQLASAGEDSTIRLWDPLLWSTDHVALEPASAARCSEPHPRRVGRARPRPALPRDLSRRPVKRLRPGTRAVRRALGRALLAVEARRHLDARRRGERRRQMDTGDSGIAPRKASPHRMSVGQAIVRPASMSARCPGRASPRPGSPRRRRDPRRSSSSRGSPRAPARQAVQGPSACERSMFSM